VTAPHSATGATIVIVDDHDEFRSRARKLLERAGYRVVGEAADGTDAIAETRRLEPDIVLVDIQLPGRDGFSIARELALAPDAPKVVLISSREAADYGRQLLDTAALGFIHKARLSPTALEQLVGTPR
jgi:DNA-binding NarL/FixJ family response regulator